MQIKTEKEKKRRNIFLSKGKQTRKLTGKKRRKLK